MSALYLHIPFCTQACYYCDFHFSTNLSQKKVLVDCICKELEMRVEGWENGLAGWRENGFTGEQESRQELPILHLPVPLFTRSPVYPVPSFPLSSIYFGGGTPSLLGAGELRQIFQTIRRVFEVAENAEITLEANPNDLTAEKLALFREVGINRLSIGIQSFHEPHLKMLNRNHNREDSFACLERSRQAGFEKFTLDLIYGIPAPSHDIWAEDMRLAVGMGVNHISAYALTIEQKTVFGQWIDKGKMQMPNENFQAEQMEMLMDFLPAHGFEQYEISNFAKNGAYSRHNTHYWKKGAYLGVGPSAHSYNGQARQWNVSNNALYIKQIQAGVLPAETETLSETDHQNEYILTSLRTKWGCDTQIFADSPTHQRTLEMLVEQGFLTIENNLAYLTRAGKLLADAITEKLLF
jgi:oxygen-independent coproporphyrinogen-3 oxidase